MRKRRRSTAGWKRSSVTRTPEPSRPRSRAFAGGSTTPRRGESGVNAPLSTGCMPSPRGVPCQCLVLPKHPRRNRGNRVTDGKGFSARTARSRELFTRAAALMPGGVNSPVRAVRGVGGTPILFQRGEGAHLVDVDGNRYIDYLGSWGPLILGHAHPAVVAAISTAAQRGTSFGAPHQGEVELAGLICKAMPSMERVRLVSSGSEATAAAVRLARGATGRDRILKFEGCYHGAVDSFLVRAGSGVETLGLPDSPGVPSAVAYLRPHAPFTH